jgi:hypothetical protein
MKRLLTTLITVVLLSGTAEARVSSDNQAKISSILAGAGLESMWSQDVSLWVKGKGFPKYNLEGFGHQICAGTRGVGFYVITFWHQFGSGKITTVTCSS